MNVFVLIYLFLNFCLHCVFVAAHRFPLVVASRGYSPVVVGGHLTVVASYCRAQTLECWVSS